MLTIPTKEPWYSMIRRGEKKEEYRQNTKYWRSRLARYRGMMIPFKIRNGYGDNRPTLLCIGTPELRKGARPEWGGVPDEECWILSIRGVEEVTSYEEESA